MQAATAVAERSGCAPPIWRAGLSLLWLCALVFCALSAVAADDLKPLPELKSRVTDLTGSLDDTQRSALEQRIAQFERERGAQMAVLLIDSTQPEDIAAYSIRLAEAWKIGRQGVDDGIIIVAAVEDRTLRIEVGYGLEAAVTDATARRIIDEIIVPRFRERDFYGGLEAGIDRLQRVVAGESLPPPEPSSDWTMSMEDGGLFLKILIGTVIVAGFIRALIGRLAAGLLAAVVGGGAGWFLSGAWTLGAFLAGILFVGVAFGGGGSGIRGGGGGWGGSSGGGFSGGGGSFGGGGASGRW